MPRTPRSMNPPALDAVSQFLHAYVVPFGWRILGALVLWIVGGWVIRILIRLAHNAMAVRHVDKTLSSYGEAAIRVGLRVILCIALLGVFGVETTSLPALLAAVGIAIGPVLAVRPYCATAAYQQVYFDVNQVIAEALEQAGYPVPATHQVTHEAA